jgi:hypothetical protein
MTPDFKQSLTYLNQRGKLRHMLTGMKFTYFTFVELESGEEIALLFAEKARAD